MLLSREDSDAVEAFRREADDDILVQLIAATRSGVIRSISAIDAGDLACSEEFAALLQREDVTPNEVGRFILSARNEWAERVARRMCE